MRVQERPSLSPTPQSGCFQKLPEASVSLWGQEWSPSGRSRLIPRQQGKSLHIIRGEKCESVSDERKKK